MNKLFAIIILFLTCLTCSAEIIQDEFAIETLTNVAPPQVNTKYDYTDTTSIPVKLIVAKKVKSEQELYEGQTIDFRLAKHIVYKNKIIAKRGTIVPAKVKIIITSGMNGIPASIILDNFQIPNIKPNQITDMYEVFGQDRSLIVFPLKWALTILPPTGSLTNFIKGGHAKLKTNKTITLYYHPNW